MAVTVTVTVRTCGHVGRTTAAERARDATDRARPTPGERLRAPPPTPSSSVARRQISRGRGTPFAQIRLSSFRPIITITHSSFRPRFHVQSLENRVKN